MTPHKKVIELVVVYRQLHVPDVDAVEHQLAIVLPGSGGSMAYTLTGDPDCAEGHLGQLFVDAASGLARLLASSPSLPL